MTSLSPDEGTAAALARVVDFLTEWGDGAVCVVDTYSEGVILVLESSDVQTIAVALSAALDRARTAETERDELLRAIEELAGEWDQVGLICFGGRRVNVYADALRRCLLRQKALTTNAANPTARPEGEDRG